MLLGKIERMRSRRLHLAVRALFITAILLLVTACSDNAMVKESKEDLKDVNCMRLVVFPPDKFLSDTVQKLYDFDDKCPYTLIISQKSGITCNSNQNADKKILANFPSGYIRLDLTKGSKTIFSYYRDLTDRVDKGDEEDIQRAFERLQETINEDK